jgi:hypothetical protein
VLLEEGRVFRGNEVAMGGDDRAGGKGELAQSLAERPAGEIDRRIGGVVELDPLEFVEVIGGVV